MSERKEQRQRLIMHMLDLGEIMLESGAEVSRVEDTITRLGKAYGFVRVDTFTIIYSIVVTMCDADGSIYTQTRRIQNIGTDMEKIRQCNALSREACRVCLTEEALGERIRCIRQAPRYQERTILLAWACASAAFTVFFGGGPADLAVSFCSAMLLRLMVAYGQRAGIQNFVLYFLNSFLAGMLILMVTSQNAVFSYDKIAMGNIMLLIPGIALTTAVRDMIRGDLLSGSLEMCGALIQAAAIAVGFAAAFLLF